MRILGNKQGFTLVELSLSIAFMAILSITVALIINDAISTYRRGLTLNQINTMGMDLVDDIRAAVQDSPAKSPKSYCEGYTGKFKENCEGDMGKKLVFVKKVGKVNDKDNTPLFGAFCTGKYSYIWNSGYLFSDEANVEPDTRAGLEGFGNDFRLVKVEDDKRSVCASVLPNEYDNGAIKNEFKNNSGTTEEPVVLIINDKSNVLALYDLSSGLPAINDVGNTAFYSMSFILGTIQGGINVMSSGNFCAAPGEYDSNFDYCAINKFNFAAQANGKNGG